ncbi:VPLPA-CTERM sorting domain-containing protein [Haematobacter genomosp. 1]|uniref:PEP-CTERM sorting domain-containing protein n=1 Tax=Haematobacter genomosp. 1 TaxID=366618 RepID=A0A212AGF1_9RHOB|nr:VPLPA-CTERM sorting domain-containing protein [Haematobacter genomosp. 1]OWJ80499.1 hypothetical protein CDV49_01540 [Haematobacter genomosp. 1]
MSKKHALAAILAAAAVTAADAGNAATIVIDEFVAPQYVVARAPSGNFARSEIRAPSTVAVGGYRDMSVTNSTSRLNGTSLETGDGYLDFNNASRTSGTGTITWDGQNSTGLRGLDVTDGGTNDAVFFSVVFADADIAMAFSITDTQGRVSTFNTLLVEEFSDPAEVIFRFSDFSGSADFTQVNAISFTLIGTRPAVDASLDRIYFGATVAPVPLPATAPLLFAAMGGLAFAARRRK